MHTAYTFGVQHVRTYVRIYYTYLVSSYLGRDRIRCSEGTPDEHTEYTAKKEAANTTLLRANCLFKICRRFFAFRIRPRHLLRWYMMNISRSLAVVVRTSTSNITLPRVPCWHLTQGTMLAPPYPGYHAGTLPRVPCWHLTQGTMLAPYPGYHAGTLPRVPCWHLTQGTMLAPYPGYHAGTLPRVPCWHRTQGTMLAPYPGYHAGTLPRVPCWHLTQGTMLAPYPGYHAGTLPRVPCWHLTQGTMLAPYSRYRAGTLPTVPCWYRFQCKHSISLASQRRILHASYIIART